MPKWYQGTCVCVFISIPGMPIDHSLVPIHPLKRKTSIVEYWLGARYCNACVLLALTLRLSIVNWPIVCWTALQLAMVNATYGIGSFDLKKVSQVNLIFLNSKVASGSSPNNYRVQVGCCELWRVFSMLRWCRWCMLIGTAAPAHVCG